MKTGTQLAAVHTSIDFRAEPRHLKVTLPRRFAIHASARVVRLGHMDVRIESGNTTGLVT